MVNIDKVKARAKLKGLKLSHLCAEMGEDPTYFDKVKKGIRRMDDNRIMFLAEKLDTSYEYLTDQESELSENAAIDSQITHQLAKIRYYRRIKDSPELAETEEMLVEMIRKKQRVPKFDYDRLNERRIARHLTHDYIEAQLGLPEDYWEDVRDGYRDTDEQTVSRLAVLLETTYDYLMGLTDDPRIPSDDKTGVKIGVFGDVAAGIPIKQIENFDPEDPDSWEEIDRWTAKSGLYFALKIKGDSMSPRILEGDVVIVRKQPMVESNQLAVVAINGDTATCKKVLWDEQGGMFLVSLNSAYPPRYFSAADVQNKITILGQVVELRAKTF